MSIHSPCLGQVFNYPGLKLMFAAVAGHSATSAETAEMHWCLATLQEELLFTHLLTR
jgi:hypothetical protein